jgi:dTDP-4-dehydrorhamnose 3,5-epimerase
MTFTETALSGAFVLDPELRRDPRGFFARVFSQEEMTTQGLDPTLVQGSVSFNHAKGTLRGMHFQFPPKSETKLVRCTRGAILDVIVDLRPESPTFLQHVAVELSADNHRSLFVPRRFAHGYQTLDDNTEVAYWISAAYAPTHEGGIAFNDPALAIRWPLEPTVMSDRDRTLPTFAAVEATVRARMAAAEPERA